MAFNVGDEGVGGGTSSSPAPDKPGLSVGSALPIFGSALSSSFPMVVG